MGVHTASSKDDDEEDKVEATSLWVLKVSHLSQSAAGLSLIWRTWFFPLPEISELP